jgi:pyrroline-5-carboxylate reductase
MHSSERNAELMAGLDAVEQDNDRIRLLDDALRGREPAYSLALIEQMHDTAVSVEALAVKAAVQAVKRGHISRRAAADRLGMHSHTLQRFIDQPAEDDREEIFRS